MQAPFFSAHAQHLLFVRASTKITLPNPILMHVFSFGLLQSAAQHVYILHQTKI